MNKDKTEFELVPERVKIVKEIFDLSINGMGNYSICRKLNGRKERTWGRGKGWHSSYIQKILENRSVLGEFQPRSIVDGKYLGVGDVVKDYFPKIISEDDFFFGKGS